MKTLLLFVLFPLFAFGQYQRVSFEATPAQFKVIASKGVALDHLVKNDRSFIGEFSAAETVIIQRDASNVVILIADLAKYNRERYQKDRQKASRPSAALPKYFGYGSLLGYLTYGELMKKLDTIIAAYPKLISTKSVIGKTAQGKDIISFKISDNPNSKEKEPEVLYTAMHHAREPMSMMQMLYFVCAILEKYPNDTSIQRMVNNTELYFIPCVNPDGYVYNEEQYKLGGSYFWRKNRKVTSDTTIGVDLNRNYEYQWGYDDIGSSPFLYSDTYRGKSAFSELETQTIRDFCSMHTFKGTLNYHAFSNVFIYPFGTDTICSAPDADVFEKYAEALTSFNGYQHGTGYQTLSYTTNGNSDDWMYGEQIAKPKIFSFTPEVGSREDGFWPPFDRILPLCEDNFLANVTFANLWSLGSVTGVANTAIQSFELYPNPANKQLFFTPFDGSCVIQSVTGQVLLEAPAQSGNITVETLSPGVYLCYLKNKSERSAVQKLMITQ